MLASMRTAAPMHVDATALIVIVLLTEPVPACAKRLHTHGRAKDRNTREDREWSTSLNGKRWRQ